MTASPALAVVGAGLIGRAHIDRVRAADDCRLLAIADPSPAAAALAAGLGVPVYDGVEQLLEAERPDGIILATPNSLHADQAVRCIVAGVPVLIEKPVADTVAAADRIVEAAQRHGTPVLVGHHRRHSPALQAARGAIRQGKLGYLATVTAMTTFLKPDAYFEMTWRKERGGGPVLINLIHVIDDIRFLCGDFARLQAITSSSLRGFPVEDSAAIAFQLENGAVGTITLSDIAAAPWSWELTSGENPAYPQQTSESCYFIAGTAGSLAVPTMRHWFYQGDAGWFSPISSQVIDVEAGDPLARQLQHFCAVIRGEEQPLASAEDSRTTLAVTLKVLEIA